MYLRALFCLLVLAGCTAMDSTRRDAQTVASSVGNLVVDGVPDVPRSVLAGLDRYRNTRSASLLGWLGDGVLIATRFGNTTQLHRVEAPLGMRRQITFFPEPVAGASVNPDPGRNGFVYLKDTGGSEFYQMFWYDNATTDSMLLSDGTSRYTGVSWSPSGNWLGYSTTEANGVDWDLHAQDLRGRRLVLQEGEGVGWSIEDWSDDESRVLVSQYISVNESHLYEVHIDTGERRRLLADVSARVRRHPLRSRQERLFHVGHEQRVPPPAPARPRQRRDHRINGRRALGRGILRRLRRPPANRLCPQRRRGQSAVRPQPGRRRLHRPAPAATRHRIGPALSPPTTTAWGLPSGPRQPPRTSSASISAPGC